MLWKVTDKQAATSVLQQTLTQRHHNVHKVLNIKNQTFTIFFAYSALPPLLCVKSFFLRNGTNASQSTQREVVYDNDYSITSKKPLAILLNYLTY